MICVSLTVIWVTREYMILMFDMCMIVVCESILIFCAPFII